jgi:peptidyl-prolyl cis-trans isomerase D
MTMLDRMRRHKGWLKWSLAIVVVAFIWLYIPTFMDSPAGAGVGNRDVVATVDGRDITVARFRRAYQQQLQVYRNAYGANFDDRLLRQLGIEQRIVQQMIEEELALAEADRLGMGASDEEVRARIGALPAFQENGQFVGDQRYRQILQSANPPLRASDFEEQVRRGIVLEKLQAALTGWVTVSDGDVDEEFRRRNEKIKLAVVSFPADKFREGLTATDEELAAHFEANKSEYRIPEKRKIRYALVDSNALREQTPVSPEEARQYYDANVQQYSTPEQMRARHILLKTEGKDEAAVKKQAEDLLAQIKKGADFAALATKFSEDEGSATKGGDLDFFPRNQMVKEFEEAAFALEPGQVSDLVKTTYGYHIIKAGEKKAASTRSFEEVRPQIEDQLKWERAQKEAERRAADIAAKLDSPDDFDSLPRGNALIVSESGFFARDEPIAGLGVAPGVTSRAFELPQGEVSESINTPQGIAFITVTGTQEARDPSLDEVKARVREDVLKAKAVDAARQKAAALAAQLKGGQLEAAAKSAGLEVKTTELIPRDSPIPDVGISAEVDRAAFALDVGAVSEPITTDAGAVIVKVLDKQGVTDEELAKGRQAVRDELLDTQRNRFYGAYMTKVRDRVRDRIRINTETLAQLLG